MERHARIRKVLSTGTAVLLIAGCESLAPEARAVKIAASDADVAGCTMLGTVSSAPPYVGPNDGMNQLKNKAAALGGNVLYSTSSGLMRGKNGVAYRCPK